MAINGIELKEMVDICRHSMGDDISVDKLHSDFSSDQIAAVRGLSYRLTSAVVAGVLDPQSPSFFSDMDQLLRDNPTNTARLKIISKNERLGGLLLETSMQAKSFERPANG